MALARGDTAQARAHFDAALSRDPASVPAHLALADLASDPAQARAHIVHALEMRPGHPGALARLAEHTGQAPRRAASLRDALVLAEAHPFDAKARLDAGVLLAEAGRPDEAAIHLEAVLGLTDVAPEEGARALEALREVDPDWADRRVVPVHVFLDAALRSQDGWRFRQRMLWQEVSLALEPLLATRFLPVSFTPFDAAPPDARLDSRLRGLVYQTQGREEAALFAGFTAEPTPSRVGAQRGVAVYAGRQLFVRDEPEEPVVRVLAHELMHVYGAIHVSDDIDSLMNPSGESTRIDALNADIVRSIATRGFETGGQERNVLARIDREETAAAFTRALQVNLSLREAGLADLLGDASVVGPGAWSRMQQIKGLDRHMADVAVFTGRLFWSSNRRAQAVALFELASQLYGPQSPQGRAAWTQAEVLRRRLRFELGASAE